MGDEQIITEVHKRKTGTLEIPISNAECGL